MKLIVRAVVFVSWCYASMSIGKEVSLWMKPSCDLVGTGSVATASGIDDWHIRIESDRLGALNPAAWRVRGGLWYSMVDKGQWRFPYDKSFSCWDSLLKVNRSGAQADLYFEPLLAWPGDIFEVEAILPDSSMLSWRLLSNGEGWLAGGRWLGQCSTDRLGPAKIEADGIRDWKIKIVHSFINGEPARVDVWLPYNPIGNRLTRRKCFDHWSTAGDAMPLLCEPSQDGVTIYLNPVLACGGDEFFVRVVRRDNSWAMWKVIGIGSDWETGGIWFGQDTEDYVSEYASNQPNGIRDWHLQVASPRLTSPVRWMVRGAKCAWETKPEGVPDQNPEIRALAAFQRGSCADLYFEPAMERAGDVFYVSAILSDGSLLNWGVTSVRQIRGNDITWRGQVPDHTSTVADGGVTNYLNQWAIAVKHEKLAGPPPYFWRIKGNNMLWQTPPETADEDAQVRPITVDSRDGSAVLYIDPEWAKPGTPFDVEAAFADGTLVQWTVLADGAEWAGAAQWLDSAGADYVGHTHSAAPDDKPDWVIRISDDKLRNGVAELEIYGAGWRWHWPEVGTASPIRLDLGAATATINIAPVPGKRDMDSVLTIRALLSDGSVRFWQALQPTRN